MNITTGNTNITIGSGALDTGAWHRAVLAARWLHDHGKWDGIEPITINDAYATHDKCVIEWREKSVEGIDYEFPQRKSSHIEIASRTTYEGTIWVNNKCFASYRTIRLGKFNNEPHYQVYVTIPHFQPEPQRKGLPPRQVLVDMDVVLFTSKNMLAYVLIQEVASYLMDQRQTVNWWAD